MPPRRARGRSPVHLGARLAAVLVCAGTLLGAVAPAALAAPAPLTPAGAASAAAQQATAGGYRTGVAVLDLATGGYAGAGQDTAAFPSESVVKVLIAARLLLTGQMDGATAATARRMITASDDDAANALYPRAGGDSVAPLVAAHYGVAGFAAPPVPGRWGLTPVTAQGVVRLYAALAHDPAVWPWLGAAMTAASRTAADGTDQFFGLPAATGGAAIKQGWGHDGAGAAVANSTGVLAGGRYAVAVLTSGPATAYGGGVEAVVTAEARALLPGGVLPGSAPAAPAAQPRAAAPAPSPAARLRGALADVPWRPVAGVAAVALTALGVAATGRRALRHLAGRRADRLARLRARRPVRPAAPGLAGLAPGVVVRLPGGRLAQVRVAGRAA